MTNSSSRYYLCARCKVPVYLCTHCDRGNRYCSEECANKTRSESHRNSNRRYQSEHIGKLKNKFRQRGYRARIKQKRANVTEQGSKGLPNHRIILLNQDTQNAELTNKRNSRPILQIARRVKRTVKELLSLFEDTITCTFCGKVCASQLRYGSLGASKMRFRTSPG